MNSDENWWREQQLQEQQIQSQWRQEQKDKLFREYALEQLRQELAGLSSSQKAEFEQRVSAREKERLVQIRADRLKQKYGDEIIIEVDTTFKERLKQFPQEQSSLPQDYLDFKQRETAESKDRKRSDEQGLLGTLPPDSPRDFQSWYYAGKASEELQISLGVIPPQNITPAGAVWYSEVVAYSKRQEASRMIEVQKERLKEAGLSAGEIEKMHNALHHQAYDKVSESWKKENAEALKAWQESKELKSFQKFSVEVGCCGDSKELHATVPDSLRAKVEAQREKYGTTERQSQKSQDIEIER